jgi:tetratricopeptide (TPR) repeat protein
VIFGKVVEEPWINFAYNRTKALQQIRTIDVDYVLIIDADEVLEFDVYFQIEAFKKSLTKDLYNITTKNGDISYQRPQLFKNELDFYYKGVLHEFLECSSITSRGDIEGIVNKPSHDGHRSQNVNKFQDDAKVLEAILLAEQDPFMISRYTFYLAQSYRDYGDNKSAIVNYNKRAKLGFWQEEVYVSLLNAARLIEVVYSNQAETINAYMLAVESLPDRMEARHDLIKYCRLNNYYNIGYSVATIDFDIKPPSGLFIEDWIYEYGMLFEFSIISYWAGHYKESLTACDILLLKDIPDNIKDQVQRNKVFSEDKLK